ncbi:MAG: response regulator [Desulfovibrionaceae bacterium]|jgi:PleD family two-component response regulator|nr:response regulator [Desulfovibrionaceae bacterium]
MPDAQPSTALPSFAELPHTVLVVEDSPVQAKIISKQIEALTAFPTLIANTMEQTEALLAAHAADVFIAVVDLNLPDAPDGEAVDLVMSHGVPCIVLTATFNDELRQKFLDKRVVDYFFKGSIQDMDPMVSSLERVSKNRLVKVLLVDDSRMERNYIRSLLKVQNFQVVEASDGLQALEVLENNPDVRMIITDYEMPKMDGFEFIKQVRQRHKKDSVAIIGVSAAGSGALSALLLKNGANDFLTKPFEAEEFYCRANQNIEIIDIIEELKVCREAEGS